MSTSSLGHVYDDKKELARDICRLIQLGVRLVDFAKGCVMLHKGYESSLVVDVKEKKDLDPTLVEFKESTLKKYVKSLFQWGDGIIRYQTHYVSQMLIFKGIYFIRIP